MCWTAGLKATGRGGLDVKLYSIDFFTTSSKGRKLKKGKKGDKEE